MYAYNAELYCDDCGARLADLASEDMSDDYPVSARESESDSPNHCASGAYCLNALDLTAYGLAEDAPLFGAETRKIGALIEEDLTEDGVAYVREMIECDPEDCTPYQRALHAFWRESFPAVTDAAIEDARTRGREDGVAAGSWILDGNSTEDAARTLLRGMENCDPAVMDSLPGSPLSGEFADGLLPRDLLADYGLTEDDTAADDLLTAYEDGYAEGVMDEAERSARALLGI